MERLSIDAYVIDVLMPDLVGHDRRPATFVVYLFLLRQVAKARRDTVSVSLDHCGKNWVVKIDGADRVAASATKKAHRSEHCCDRDRAGATGDATMGAGLASTDVLCFAPIGCGKAVTARRRLRVGTSRWTALRPPPALAGQNLLLNTLISSPVSGRSRSAIRAAMNEVRQMI